jgi:hypothetical protein
MSENENGDACPGAESIREGIISLSIFQTFI